MPDWPALTAASSVTFADLLRHHRTAAGLTQEELAARAGLSSDAISTLERGARRRPRKDTIALLAEALDLPDEERAAFAATARRLSFAALAATPPAEASVNLDGHAPDLNGRAPDASPEATLPHGVVTFLFADLEGSTRLLHELGGDRYAGVLAELQALLGAVWAAHAGHELGTQGDRFFAVFAYADDALSAAAAAQQALAAHSWPDGTAVRPRMGLHCGAALLTAGRYVGLEVHRAARIAAAAHGGQVVVSAAVADQVAKFGYALPAGTRLRDLGKHRLMDLPHREELYQLVLPNLPGLPTAFPPLRTLDAWPGLRADLTVVVGMSAALLTVVGLLLALLVPAFPWAIGLGAAALALLVLLAAVLAQPVRHALETQWRDARKPFATVTSSLLSLVVVLTTLFITKPPIFIGPKHLGYDFSYTYHAPTHKGGTVTVGLFCPVGTLAPGGLGNPQSPCTGQYEGLWQSCVVQLPDLSLGLSGWKPDQCAQVPTIANSGESVDGRTTIFHIDPHAVWSDGTPVIAADFLFAHRLFADPNIDTNGPAPFNLMQLSASAPDSHTVEIHWAVPYGDFLAALAAMPPLPLHVYAIGAFAGVYDPRTDMYDSKLAQRLLQSPDFNTTIPVDNGPFTVQSFPPSPATWAFAGPAVLARNPRFFSNFFHKSALDQVTLVSAARDFAAARPFPSNRQLLDDLLAQYRGGQLTLAEGFDPLDLRRLGGIPKGEVTTSPDVGFLQYGFNERDVAPNTKANGGTSMFMDPTVRQAFVEAFDRCAAVRALLGIATCHDPNLFSDELTARSFPDYDATFTLPAYNPAEAAALLERAGYPLVGNVRRAKDGKTPLQLQLVLSHYGTEAIDLARSMQEDYARYLHIGVTVVTPAENPFRTYDQGGQATTGAFDILLYSNATSPDPVGHFTGYDAADIPSAQNPSGGNWFGILDPHLGEQDQLGSEAIDGQQRAEVYRVLQRYFAQQFYILPVYISADVSLTKATLCNFKQWPEWLAATWNMADWYVGSSCP